MVQWANAILAELRAHPEPDEFNKGYCLILEDYLTNIHVVDWNQLPVTRTESTIVNEVSRSLRLG